MADSIASGPAFKIQSVSDADIEVVHLAEGHRYIFPVIEDENGRELLGGGIARDAGASKPFARFFFEDARRFAEIKAQKLGKID